MTFLRPHLTTPSRRLAGRIASVLSAPFLLPLLLLLASPTAQAGNNIFDDDWTPPPRRAEPATLRPATPAPQPDPKPPAHQDDGPPKAVPPNASKPPKAPPAAAAPAAAPAAVRLAIPPAADLARSRAQLKALYARQLDDRTPLGRRQLATTFLADITRVADNPTDQYTLMGGAITAGREGSSLRLCFQAIDRMAREFDVDAIGAKVDATLGTRLRADSPPITAENVRAALELLDPLLERDDLTSAARLCAAMGPAAAGSADGPIVQRRTKEIDAVRREHERVAQSLERLKTSPDDPSLNLRAGTYYAMTRGAWNTGLPMLAKGPDAPLKALAAAELAAGADAAALSEAADGWWDYGQKQPEPARAAILRHAATLYKPSVATATGLRRQLLDKRIAETLPPEEDGRIDLLPLIDPAQDIVKGKPMADNGALVSTAESDLVIEFPYAPPLEYDFSVVFTDVEGGGIGQGLAVPGGHQLAWTLASYDGKWCWFEVIQGNRYGRAKDSFSEHWMEPGKRYTSTVKVRQGKVEAYLGDKLIAAYETDYHEVSLPGGYDFRRHDTIGLKIWKKGISVEAAYVIEVTGQGSFTRTRKRR
jgi:hypothetical protein